MSVDLQLIKSSVLGGGDVRRGQLVERADALAGGPARFKWGASFARASGATANQVKAMVEGELVDLARQTSDLAREVVLAFGMSQPKEKDAAPDVMEKAKPVSPLARMLFGPTGKVLPAEQKDLRSDGEAMEQRVRAMAAATPPEGDTGFFMPFLSKLAAKARRRQAEQAVKERAEADAAVARAKLVREGRVVPL